MLRTRTWLGIALLGGAAGCATGRLDPAAMAAAETEKTMTTLRAQNGSYVRQIEELQNRVFILEDRLDSQRVAEQQRTSPALPVVKTLRAEPPPVRVAEPRPVEPAPAPSELLPADSQVEYAGEAMQGVGPRPERPVLRNTPGRQAVAAATPAVRPAAVAPRRPTLVVTQKPTPVVAKKTPAARPTAAAKVMPVVAVVPPPTPAPPVVVAPAVAPAPKPAPEPVAVREGSEWRDPIPAEPLRLYRDALEALRAGHHAAALAGFRRFIDRNPVHDYADNAQYWIGECYYDLHQYQAATREFRAVIERYPHGNKVPDAMLKLGFSHLALGQGGDGQQVLEALVRAYPKHTSAGLATARLSEPPFGFKANVSLGTIAPRPAVTR